ncbi:MAG: hypothetical protein QOG88_1692 [Actinomycetota bacterium]|nr:hypothetical protein [Actinomycetota bacterium]
MPRDRQSKCATAPSRARRWGSRGVMLTITTAVLVLGGPWANAAAIVDDGDFESPTVPAGDFATVEAGSTIGSWYVVTGSVDVVGDYVPGGFGWHPASGVQSIDLAGANPGSIVQRVPTVPGQLYLLRFAMAGNPAGGPKVKRMAITWNHGSLERLSFDSSVHTLDSMGWQYHEYTVMATKVHTQLKFRAAKSEFFCGPTLDDVSVTPAP